MRTIKTLGMIAMTICMVLVTGLPHSRFGAKAYAEEGWKTEFDDICVKTNEAMTLPKAEVKSLIERCDKLKPRIETLEESARKVYLKRLQMCRDLFVYVLESTTPQQ
jgi:hypothetical protein